ncbi:hypothetical protein RYA05_00400 [Pseudomonas syringae pv. actinidiae]|nr:hypothetical protein [Pseudomonas syringae pv. actinidiae]
MESQKLNSFEAKQLICSILLQEGFTYIEGGSGKRACVWEKPLNDSQDVIEVLVQEQHIGLFDDIDALTFNVNILMEGIMHIDVINHNLTFEDFTSLLRCEIDRAQALTESLRHTTKLVAKGSQNRNGQSNA